MRAALAELKLMPASDLAALAGVRLRPGRPSKVMRRRLVELVLADVESGTVHRMRGRTEAVRPVQRRQDGEDDDV